MMKMYHDPMFIHDPILCTCDAVRPSYQAWCAWCVGGDDLLWKSIWKYFIHKAWKLFMYSIFFKIVSLSKIYYIYKAIKQSAEVLLSTHIYHPLTPHSPPTHHHHSPMKKCVFFIKYFLRKYAEFSRNVFLMRFWMITELGGIAPLSEPVPPILSGWTMISGY